MARWPGAIWAPLPENETEPRIHAVRLIIHTAVDRPGPSNIPAYFGRRDIYVESHLWFPFAGPPVQMMDTDRQADANYRANNDSLSAETEDDGDPVGNPWNDHQLDGLTRFVVWCHRAHGIPLRLCESPTDAGIGWHAMWSYPSDPVGQTGRAARSPWTNALGKTCPGTTRIRQLVDQVLPRAVTMAGLDGDVDRLTRQQIGILHRAVLGRTAPEVWVADWEARTSPLDRQTALWLLVAELGEIREADQIEVATATDDLGVALNRMLRDGA